MKTLHKSTLLRIYSKCVSSLKLSNDSMTIHFKTDSKISDIAQLLSNFAPTRNTINLLYSLLHNCWIRCTKMHKYKFRYSNINGLLCMIFWVVRYYIFMKIYLLQSILSKYLVLLRYEIQILDSFLSSRNVSYILCIFI